MRLHRDDQRVQAIMDAGAMFADFRRQASQMRQAANDAQAAQVDAAEAQWRRDCDARSAAALKAEFDRAEAMVAARLPGPRACELCASGGACNYDFRGVLIMMCPPCWTDVNALPPAAPSATVRR